MIDAHVTNKAAQWFILSPTFSPCYAQNQSCLKFLSIRCPPSKASLSYLQDVRSTSCASSSPTRPPGFLGSWLSCRMQCWSTPASTTLSQSASVDNSHTQRETSSFSTSRMAQVIHWLPQNYLIISPVTSSSLPWTTSASQQLVVKSHL